MSQYFGDTKDAEYKIVRGIGIFYAPNPDPMGGGPRQAVYDPRIAEWRWRDDGSLLTYIEYAAIDAELARRQFEKELQDEEICRKVGI